MSVSRFLGWVCLLLSWGFYLSDGMASFGGRFLNGMAIGFFLHSLYEGWKELQEKKRKNKNENK
jgi:hypothetical protein